MPVLNNYNQIIFKILWPRKLSVIGGVTAISGVFADVVKYITNNALPPLYLLILSIAVFLFFFLKLKSEVLKEELPLQNEKLDSLYEGQGENSRFLLFITAGFMLAWVTFLTTGPVSVTEKILIKLNIIDDRLIVIGDKIDNLEEILKSGVPVKNPSTAGEYYINATIYSYSQGDINKAWDSIQGLYQNFPRGKMDSAKFFYETGKKNIGSKKTKELMRQYYEKNHDPALLYYLSEAIRDPEERRSAFTKMQKIFPDYPFSYWNRQKVGEMTYSSIDYSLSAEKKIKIAEEKLQVAEDKVKEVEIFLTKIEANPVSKYYYHSVFMMDWEGQGHGVLTSLKMNAKTAQMRVETEKLKQQQKIDGENRTFERNDEKPNIKEFTFNRRKDGVSIRYGSLTKGFRRSPKYSHKFEGKSEFETNYRLEHTGNIPLEGEYILKWQEKKSGRWHGPYVYKYKVIDHR